MALSTMASYRRCGMAASMLLTLLSLGPPVYGAQNRSTLRTSFSPYDYELSVSIHTDSP